MTQSACGGSRYAGRPSFVWMSFCRDWLWTLTLVVSHSDYVAGERAYSLGCSREDPSFYDYENYPFPPPQLPVKSVDDYLLVRRLGTGKFSDVFEAVDAEQERKLFGTNHQVDVDPNTLVVIKCLKPVTERKIRRELLVLSHASKLPNLARLLGVVQPDLHAGATTTTTTTTTTSLTASSQMPSLVLQHAGLNSQWLCHRGSTATTNTNQQQQQTSSYASPAAAAASFLSEYEIKYFLLHLLFALDSLHSKGIMHRDIKPRNILINRRHAHHYSPLDDTNSSPKAGLSSLMLIDLGLADFYLPDTRYNVRVASRHYKSPELLVGFEYYDYGIDIWGVGCILAGLLFRREPFFRGKDNPDQLQKIVSVLGTTDLIEYMSKYNIEYSSSEMIQTILSKAAVKGFVKRKPWNLFRVEECPPPSPMALDLLDKLLVYDHDHRLTAKQALQHPFFDAVRDRVAAEVQVQQNALLLQEQARGYGLLMGKSK